MTQSLNEIEALAKKAARGAGMAWGMAEEAGKATRVLSDLGLNGAAALVDLLGRNDGVDHGAIAPQGTASPWSSASGTLCPIAAGALLSDCAGQLEGGAIEMHDVSHSVLLVPFVAMAAGHLGRPVVLSWVGGKVIADGAAVWLDDPNQRLSSFEPMTLTCALGQAGQGAPLAAMGRGRIDGATWDALNRFAGRTYAPATELSRQLGAGAGNSDND